MVPLTTGAPIVNAANPGNVLKKPARPTCASYKEALTAAIVRRLCRSLITIYAFSLIFTILFQARFAWPTNFLSWSTFTYSIALFVFLAPLFGFRLLKTTLWQPVPPSEGAEFLMKATNPDNWIVISAYAISSLLIIRLYCSHLVGETYTDEFFVYPYGQRFGARQLNQDNLFISLYALVLGAGFGVRRIWRCDQVLHIPAVQQPAVMALKLSLSTVIWKGTRWAIKTFWPIYAVFIIFNGSLYRLIASFFGTYTKMLDTPVIGFSWLNLRLFLRLIIGGSLTASSWEMLDRIFDVLIPVRESLVRPLENANECLLSGLRLKEEPIVQAVAFAELAEIATKRSDQRATLFRDTGKGVHDTAWTHISRECINVIEALRKDIEKEYKGTQQAAAPVPVQKPVEVTPPNRIQLLEADILQTPKTSATLLDDRTGTLFTQVSTVAETVISPQPVKDTATQDVIPKQRVYQFLQLLAKKVEKCQSIQDLFAVTAERRTRAIFSNYLVIVWAVQSLGSLVAASMNEDPYGLVQRDIGAVLDVLLGCVIDVEKFVRKPPAEYTTLRREHDGDVMLMEPEAVLLALREAIYQIVTTFRDYLDGIKVQNKYAEKWKQFVEFRE